MFVVVVVVADVVGVVVADDVVVFVVVGVCFNPSTAPRPPAPVSLQNALQVEQNLQRTAERFF